MSISVIYSIYSMSISMSISENSCVYKHYLIN